MLYHKLNYFIHRVSPSWVRERSLSHPQLDRTHLEVLLAEVLAVVSNDKFSTNLKLLLDHGEKLISIKLTVALFQSVSGYITNWPLRISNYELLPHVAPLLRVVGLYQQILQEYSTGTCSGY